MSEKENQSDIEIWDPLPEAECFAKFVRNDLVRAIEKAMVYINSKPHVVMALYPHYCRLGDGVMHSMAIVEIGGKHYSVEIDVMLHGEMIYVRSKDFGVISVHYDRSTCKAISVGTEIPNELSYDPLKELRYHDIR